MEENPLTDADFDEFRAAVAACRGAATEYDPMLTGDRPLWGFTCIAQIQFYWDQWMKCSIVCTHGRYSGVSNGARDAMAQSLERASGEFRKVEALHEFDW